MPRLPDAYGHFGPYGGRYVAETSCRRSLSWKMFIGCRRIPEFRRELRTFVTGVCWATNTFDIRVASNAATRGAKSIST